MKAKIKMGNKKYEGELKMGVDLGEAQTPHWWYFVSDGVDYVEINAMFGHKTEAEAIADAKAHGITVEGK